MASLVIYISSYPARPRGITVKYGKHTHQLKFKRELKKFPFRNKGGQRKSLHTGVK